MTWRITVQLPQLETPDPRALIAGLMGAAAPASALRWFEDNPAAPLGYLGRRSLAKLASRQTLLIYTTPAEAETDDLGAETMGRPYRDHHDALHDLGVHVIAVSTLPLAEHERASVELYPQTLLCDEQLVLARALRIPVTITFHAARVDYAPIVLIVREGVISHVIYPVASPDASARAAVQWLTEQPRDTGKCSRARVCADDVPRPVQKDPDGSDE